MRDIAYLSFEKFDYNLNEPIPESQNHFNMKYLLFLVLLAGTFSFDNQNGTVKFIATQEGDLLLLFVESTDGNNYCLNPTDEEKSMQYPSIYQVSTGAQCPFDTNVFHVFGTRKHVSIIFKGKVIAVPVSSNDQRVYYYCCEKADARHPCDGDHENTMTRQYLFVSHADVSDWCHVIGFSHYRISTDNKIYDAISNKITLAELIEISMRMFKREPVTEIEIERATTMWTWIGTRTGTEIEAEPEA